MLIQLAKDVLSFGEDGIIHFSPCFFPTQENFVFLAHPGTTKDVAIKWRWTKRMEEKNIEAILSKCWPASGPSHKIDKEKMAQTLYIPISAKMILEDREMARRKIVKAAKNARKRGAKIIGLGGLTAAAVNYGEDIKNEVDVYVATGHTFTVCSVLEILFAAIEFHNLKISETEVAIVGAGGSIGRACTQVIERFNPKKLILVDINRKALLETLGNLESLNNVEASGNISEIKPARIVISVAAAPYPFLDKENFKSDAIVIDDGWPPNVDRFGINEESNVHLIDGGVCFLPSEFSKVNTGLGLRRGFCFSCYAEGMFILLRRWAMDFVGRPCLSDINSIKEIAMERGFKPAFKSNKEEFAKFAQREVFRGNYFFKTARIRS